MTNPSVQPDPWAAIAAELERFAQDVRKLIGQPAPSYVGFDIQPYNGTEERGGDGGDAATIAATDEVAIALLGRPAEPKRMTGGAWHHTVSGVRGSIRVSVFQSISDPQAHARDAELAALRAEVDRMRAAAALTPDADPAGLRVPAEDATLTPVPPTDPDDLPAPTGVTRYFTLGEIDEQGRGYYVTVTAPTANRCRLLMVETYGTGWCDEYADLPGDYEWVQTNRLVEWEQ